MYEPSPAKMQPRVLGRYCLYDEIAAGGMATVHFGRLLGPAGFSRTVAIKQLHPQYARDPEFVAMFLDEARLAARIRHPNVVSTIDVVARDGELFLVMEYIQGEAFSRLLRTAHLADEHVPVEVASSIVVQALLGLHAAHEALDEKGVSLNIVHRDVSPQNILVGTDGVARVLDFGVAKATSRLQTTQDGRLKGKLAYMAPEQLLKRGVDRRADIFAAATVLWEALCGERLFAGDDAAAAVAHILDGEVKPPSTLRPDVPPSLDEVVLKGLAKDPDQRYQTAKEMAQALERALLPAGALRVSEWVEHTAGMSLKQRAERVAEIEDTSRHLVSDVGRDTVDSLLGPLTPSGRVYAPIAAGREAETRTEIELSPHQQRMTPSTAHQVLTHSTGAEVAPELDQSRTRRRRAILLSLAALAGATVVLVLLGVGSGSENLPEAVVTPTSPAAQRDELSSSETRDVVQPQTVKPEPVAAASVAEPTPSPPEPAGPTPEPPPSVVPPLPRQAPRPPKQPRASLRANCDPPFTVNADGTKRFKKECYSP